MERHRRYLEGEPDRDEDDPNDQPARRFRRAGEQLGQAGKTGGPGKAVDQRDAVEQHPRGERAEHEIFEPRLGRTHRISIEAGGHVERQTLQLETDIKGDQVAGGDHDHHPDRREQDQDRELEPRDFVLLVVAKTQDDRDRRAGQHQCLHENGEGVGDEHAVEAGLARHLEQNCQHDRRDQRDDRQPGDEPGRALIIERPEQQQRHRRAGKDDLRQRRHQIGDGYSRHRALLIFSRRPGESRDPLILARAG